LSWAWNGPLKADRLKAVGLNRVDGAKQILTLHHATVRAVNRDAGGLEVWIMLPTDDVFLESDKSLLSPDITVPNPCHSTRLQL
jgi:hypothetical protein